MIIPIESTKDLPKGEQLYLFDNADEALAVEGTVYQLTHYHPKFYQEWFVLPRVKTGRVG